MTDKKPEDLEGAMAAHRNDLLKKHDSYSIADIPNGQKLMAKIAKGYMDVFARLTPEEAQLVRDFYQERPQFYVGTSRSLMEALSRATYVDPSLKETEAIEEARKWFSRYSGVKKE